VNKQADLTLAQKNMLKDIFGDDYMKIPVTSSDDQKLEEMKGFLKGEYSAS